MSNLPVVRGFHKDEMIDVNEVASHGSHIADRHRRHQGVDGRDPHLRPRQHDYMDEVRQKAKDTYYDTDDSMDRFIQTKNINFRILSE